MAKGKSIKANLRALRLCPPSGGDILEIAAQVERERNDRGAAILAATLVENATTFAITRQNTKFAYYASRLFENEGPISSFDAKILIADCFGMIGPITRHNLDLIKHIRNTFAHASVPVTFSTPEIEAGCNSLQEPPIADRGGRPWGPSAREYFTAACYAIARRMGEYASGCTKLRADQVDPATLVPVTPEPLP